jgi:hypothetical protein
MKLRLLTIATVLLATTTLAQAAWSQDAIVSQYTADGYTRIEIDLTPTYAKVEAINGSDKIEVIYDLVTGNILKTERERVDGDDDTRPGVYVRNRDDDRWDDDFDDDDRWDDDRHDDRYDDDDHNDDHGGDRHRDDDHGRHGGGHDDDQDDDRYDD